MIEEMDISMDAISQNESLARICVSGFMLRLNPTLEQLEDVKTAVSEAVTNVIIHAYPKDFKIWMHCEIRGRELHIEIKDNGIGIRDIELAKRPIYTSKPDEERSGMGFSFMEAFMDKLSVESIPGEGTVIRMVKRIGVVKGEDYGETLGANC